MMKYSIYLICILAMLSIGYHYTIQEQGKLNDEPILLETSLSVNNTSSIIIEVAQNETTFELEYNNSGFSTTAKVPNNLVGNFNFLLQVKKAIYCYPLVQQVNNQMELLFADTTLHLKPTPQSSIILPDNSLPTNSQFYCLLFSDKPIERDKILTIINKDATEDDVLSKIRTLEDEEYFYKYDSEQINIKSSKFKDIKFTTNFSERNNIIPIIVEVSRK